MNVAGLECISALDCVTVGLCPSDDDFNARSYPSPLRPSALTTRISPLAFWKLRPVRHQKGRARRILDRECRYAPRPLTPSSVSGCDLSDVRRVTSRPSPSKQSIGFSSALGSALIPAPGGGGVAGVDPKDPPL